MLRRYLLIGVAAALIAAGCGGSPTTPGQVTPPPDPQPPPPPPPPPVTVSLGVTRILAFGDSMTEGTVQPPFTLFYAVDAGKTESYPYKLQALLTARYPKQAVTVFNAGSAGKRATDGERDRLASNIKVTSPEILLLMEGANDLNTIGPGPGSNAGVDATSGAMEDMVRDTLARGIPVFIATLPPQRAGGQRATGITLLPKYNGDLKTMAVKKGATVVDVNAQFPLALIGQDGLHPTEPGYDRMAEIFLDAIKQKYETTASTARR